MVDLHTHTIFSDGTWSICELLSNAELNNVTTLSITDHDTALPHIKLKSINIDKYFSGKIISGAELNCVFDGVKIELLGYDFDALKLQKWIDKTYTKENEVQGYKREFYEFLDLCKKKNIRITSNLQYDEVKKFPVKIIYDDIIKYKENKKFFTDEEWESSDVIFRKSTCNPNFILYRDFSKQYPTAKEVANKVRECGGKVFIAHLYLYSLDNYIKFLDNLRTDNIIDGVEVYYSGFTSTQIENLENYCNLNNLFMSAGTDCHGNKKPERKIGIGYNNMNISENILNWLKT